MKTDKLKYLILIGVLIITNCGFAQADTIQLQASGNGLSEISLKTWIALALGIWDVVARFIPSVKNSAPTHKAVELLLFVSNLFNRTKKT